MINYKSKLYLTMWSFNDSTTLTGIKITANSFYATN